MHVSEANRARVRRPAPGCRTAPLRRRRGWSVDRLGRSLQDLVGFLSELHALKIDLFLHQQGIGTTIPVDKALFQMMGGFAEFDRAIIQELVRPGIARARVNGTKSSKSIGRPDQRRRRGAHPRPLRAGNGIRKVAASVGSDCGELLQARLGLLQVERVEAFGEPAVDRGEKIAGLTPPALVAP